MKLSFSTEFIKRPSFFSLCQMAEEYNYSGFEIFDINSEIKNHNDSIFRSIKAQESKRKLFNRGLKITALTYPYSLDSEKATSDEIDSYVKTAGSIGCEFVICSIKNSIDTEVIIKKFEKAVVSAKKNDVEILIETIGPLADSQKMVKLLNELSGTVFGAVWNVASTVFESGETPEDTIKNLGAYIRFVRLGDRNKDGESVILGEGTLNVKEVITALDSLDFDSYISVTENDQISDPDILLTHFREYLINCVKNTKTEKLHYNRSHTGSFPFKKYDVLDMTFGELLSVLVQKYPDQPAFRYTTLDYTRTYSQFARDVDKVAAAFISLGVKKGHHVAVWATNVPEWFLCFFAATKIGAVLVTVNTAYKIHEIEYLLRQSDTHTLVMIESCKDINYCEIISELCPELKTNKAGEPLFSKRLPFLRNVITVGCELDGCLNFNDMLLRADDVSKEEVRRRASIVKPDDVANMQYTSGTTGFPKGVMLTHRNIINNGKIIGDRMDLSSADKMLIQVPMFHCFGMVLSMTSMMTHAGTLSPLPYFSPKSSLECINLEKITCFNGVPTMFLAMFNHENFAKTDFSHIRTGIMAGANCPPELMRRAAAEMNMKEIISVYGQTEASPGCTMGEVNEDLDHRVETVGSAFPGVECKIIDPETGEELPDGENGEFVARGFNIMKGYYKMPRATAEAIDKDGWLHSGDICCRMPDGYYKVTGRLKDMIIRGGENIYPREIEEFYLGHPDIKDIQVIGVPDERYGEEACAWIIMKDGKTSDELSMQTYGKKYMAAHKIPRYFIFCDSFPLNAAGKVLKYKMKEESVKILNLEK